MGKDYYKILGVGRDAEAKTIKRAYFKLVRQFSPEKDPERFQEIREAYEYLSNPSREAEDSFTVSLPNDPTAQQLYDMMCNCLKNRQNQEAIGLAERSIDLFGESEGFVYNLARAQMRAGNTGKAVKNFEKLTQRYPDQVQYRRDLAIAYQTRGYGNKALAAFRNAYERGVRDPEFLNMYSLTCNDRGAAEEGCRVLIEQIRLCKNNIRENMEYLIDAFMGRVVMAGEESSRTLEADFFAFVEDASLYIGEYEGPIAQIVEALIDIRAMVGDLDCDYFRRLIARIRKSLPNGGDQKLWENQLAAITDHQFDSDNRISQTVRDACWTFSDPFNDSTTQRFAELDLKLRMLEEWPGIRAQFQILKQDYPDYYRYFRDYAAELEQGPDVDPLRQRLLKDYIRLARQFEEAPYFRDYPERLRSLYTVSWDSGANGAYRRDGKKIGRNDPCPCGSGKKYKNCCGRN